MKRVQTTQLVREEMQRTKGFLRYHRVAKDPSVALMEMILVEGPQSTQIFKEMGIDCQWDELNEQEEEYFWADVKYLRHPTMDKMPIRHLAKMAVGINCYPEMYWMSEQNKIDATSELYTRMRRNPFEFSEVFVEGFEKFNQNGLRMMKTDWIKATGENMLHPRNMPKYDEDLQSSPWDTQWEKEWIEMEAKESCYGFRLGGQNLYSTGYSITEDGKMVTLNHHVYFRPTEEDDISAFVKKALFFDRVCRDRIKTVPFEGDAETYLKRHIPAVAKVQRLKSYLGFEFFWCKVPFQRSGSREIMAAANNQHWFLDDWRTLKFKDYINIPIPQNVTQVEKLCSWYDKPMNDRKVILDAKAYRKANPYNKMCFRNIDWDYWGPLLEERKKKRYEEARSSTQSRREKQEKKLLMKYEKDQQDKKAMGLYDIPELEWAPSSAKGWKLTLQEAETALHFHTIPDVVGVIMRQVIRLVCRQIVGEERTFPSYEGNGDGKSSTTEKRREAVIKIIEFSGEDWVQSGPNGIPLKEDNTIIHFKVREGVHVISGPVESNQVNHFFAIRKQDFGITAWVNETIPQMPYNADSISLVRILGYYQEQVLKNVFPEGMHWSEWTVFILKPMKVRYRKSSPLHWITMMGDDFIFHKPFAFTDDIVGEEVVSDLGAITIVNQEGTERFVFLGTNGKTVELPQLIVSKKKKAHLRRRRKKDQ